MPGSTSSQDEHFDDRNARRMKANGSQEPRPSDRARRLWHAARSSEEQKSRVLLNIPVKSVDIHKLDAAIGRILAKQ